MLFSWLLLRELFPERRWRFVFGISMLIDLALFAASIALIAYLASHHQA